jgi:hypothetical protein
MLDFPSWMSDPPNFGDSPFGEAGRQRTRFLLRLSAVFASEEGTISHLSELCGFARNTLVVYTARGEPVTAETAKKIERLTEGNIRAFWLRPDLFNPPRKA